MIVAQETVSSVPAVHTPKATLCQPLLRAAPLGCPSGCELPFCTARWMRGECRQIPLLGHRGAGPAGSQPRPSQCLPSATQNLSSKGTACRGTKTWPSWLSLDYQQGHLQVQSSPSGQLSLCAWGHSSAASHRLTAPRRRGSHAAASQCPCCQSPENVA